MNGVSAMMGRIGRRGAGTLAVLLCGYAMAQAPAPVPTAPAVAASAGMPAAPDSRARLKTYARELTWIQRPKPPPLDRSTLTRAIEAARLYLLNHQKPEGNFEYEYDMVLDRAGTEDHAVRQAGTLWAVTTLCRDRPTVPTRHAAIRGLDFFFRCSQPLPGGTTAPVYPGEPTVKTGTVALVCLAITEFLRGDSAYVGPVGRGLYDAYLTQYLNHLTAQESADGSWARCVAVNGGDRDTGASPYYDGEALLAYCRAARYLGRKDLIPAIERIAPLLARKYTVDAWQADRADDTKAFFQWGCLAFAEYVEAGWADADLAADAALALAWWTIYEHKIQLRDGNTAYAVEGLLAAYRVAQWRGDSSAMERLRRLSDDMLRRLIAWQAGGPLAAENPFFARQSLSPRGLGGIMTSRDSGIVRIDVVQHQLHACLMALRQFYPESPTP